MLSIINVKEALVNKSIPLPNDFFQILPLQASPYNHSQLGSNVSSSNRKKGCKIRKKRIQTEINNDKGYNLFFDKRKETNNDKGYELPRSEKGKKNISTQLLMKNEEKQPISFK